MIEKPSGTPDRLLALLSLLGWPCRGRVVLAVPAPAVAPYLADAVVEPLDDDRRRVSTGSWSWTGLAASLLRLDAGVTDVQPRELVAAFATLAARCAAVSPPSSRAGRRPARPR